MKRNWKTSIAVATMLIAGFSIFTSEQDRQLSDLALANIEALANGESGDNCRWKRVKDNYGCTFHVCIYNGDGNICQCGSSQG